METVKKSYEELVEELRDAHQLIQAIRNGKVDSILSDEPDTGVLRLENVKLAEERDRLLRELEESNRFLENVLESITHPFYVINAENYQVEISNSAARKSRFTEKNDCYSSAHSKMGKCSSSGVECSLEEIKKTKGPVVLERIMLDENKAERMMEIHAYPVFGATGKVRSVIQYLLDVTERKQAERELIEARKKAEDATNVKDKFVSLVSHDLKSPLNNMLGALQLIRNENSENAESKKIMDTAFNSGEKMLSLINELLNISRLKSGELLSKLRFVNASFFALKAMADFSSMAKKKGIQLINNIPSKKRLYADEALFYEVVFNLVSNAVKFCRQGDVITLFLPEGEPSTIAVSDTGVGIEPGRLDILYKWEEKKSTKGTEGETGTGLGLPLCHDIMQAHGGSLRVESEEGEGSIFFAELPFVRPVILLVEDDAVSRKMVSIMLRDEEAEIVTAENGEEALSVIKKQRPHLILLDLIMPKMNGFELLEHLKGDSLLKEIPVIVLTGESGIESREKAFKLGADDLITKPAREEEFLPRIRKHIL